MIRWSLPALGAAALLALVAAVTLTPAPAYTASAGLAGWPRLALYALAGILLGVTAPAACLSRTLRSDPRVNSRAVQLVILGLVASLLVSLVNALRLRTDIDDPLGPVRWVMSMAILLGYTVFPMSRRLGWRPLWPLETKVMRHRWLPLALLAGLLVLAAALRLPALDSIPQGINPDEGDRASTAVDFLNGVGPRGWFDSGWFFINMVYFRVLAASLTLFGPDVFGGRMLSALVGIAFVAVIAWIGWRNFGWRMGLLAALFATAMQMTIQHSRLITEAGPTGLLWAVSIGAFLEGARGGRPWAWALAGVSGGLSLYFYPAARLWPVGAGLTCLVFLLFLRNRRVLLGIGLAAVASIIAALPFLIHLSDHTDEVSGRYAQTAVFDPHNQERLAYLTPPEPVPQLVALQAERTLGMFDRYPDGGGFLPDNRPIFEPPMAQLALVGAVYLIVRSWRDVRLAVLAIWFWVGLSGVALTVETPDYLRSIGMLPSLCFVLAVPLADIVDRVAPSLGFGRRVGLSAAAPALLAAILLAPGVSDYFVTFRNMPSGWAPETHEGQVIAAMGATGPVYSLETNEHMVSSGWVRLLAPTAERVRMPNPGRELPAVTPVTPVATPSITRPQFFPTLGQGLSAIFSPDPNQRVYIPLLQQLYPGAVVGDGGGDQRQSIEVTPQALADTMGVTLLDSTGAQRRVDHFGDMPPDVSLSGDLVWRGGVRFPARGHFTFSATGASVTDLRVDGISVPTQAVLDVVPGLHYVELHARGPAQLEIAGNVLTPEQTYRLMDAPWGLLAKLTQALANPNGTQLDATVAMAFFDPEFGPVLTPASLAWSGELLAPRSGTYRMAFAAEDRMHLQIDGQSVDVTTVLPDDWARVGGGSAVDLSAGPHRVQVTLGITHGGRELARWNWVPPLASGAIDTDTPWTVVPPDVLRPDQSAFPT